jgi:hypothetical protein
MGLSRTVENRFPIQSGVVGGSLTKGRDDDGLCVTNIDNNNISNKMWTSRAIAIDGELLHFRVQRKLHRRDIVWILQRKNKTFQAVIAFALSALPPDGREAAEHKTANIINDCQCICVSVASTVKVAMTQTVATSSPQKSPFFDGEFIDECWKVSEPRRRPGPSTHG